MAKPPIQVLGGGDFVSTCKHKWGEWSEWWNVTTDGQQNRDRLCTKCLALELRFRSTGPPGPIAQRRPARHTVTGRP